MIKRREFISLLGGAVAWPFAARAQQSAKTRVGITSIQPRTLPIYAAFDQRLREPGYIKAQNLIVDFLNPEDQAEGIAGAIKELVRRKVDCHCAPLRTSVVVHLDAQPLKNDRPSQARSTSCWPEADLFAVQGCCGREATIRLLQTRSNMGASLSVRE